VLLQISDTHFGTEQPQVVEALVALATRQRPDVVVLSGDITQRARPAQFCAAKAFVDRLGAPARVAARAAGASVQRRLRLDQRLLAAGPNAPARRLVHPGSPTQRQH